MTFQEWLADYGEERLRRELKVTQRVIDRWRRADGWPKVGLMRKIVRLSSGALTMDVIVESCDPALRRRRK